MALTKVTGGTIADGTVIASDILDGTITDGKLASTGTMPAWNGSALTDISITGIDDNATSTAITLDSSGNVGIGTSSPSSKLNIEFNNAGNSSVTTSTIGASSIVLNDSDTSGGYRNLGLVLKTDAGEGVFYGAHRTSSSAISAVIGTNDTERMRIDSSGNVEVSTGNLVIGTSGKGIDFSADGDASGMTSELLDDYEEGTWTPTITTTNGTTTASCSLSNCHYVKIGNMVMLGAYIYNITWADVTDGTNLCVGGIPFTLKSYTAGSLAHNNTSINEIRSNPSNLIFSVNASYQNQANNSVTGTKFMLGITCRTA